MPAARHGNADSRWTPRSADTGKGRTLCCPTRPRTCRSSTTIRTRRLCLPCRPQSEPQRRLAYPTLTGFMWAARWYQLAVLEALEPFGGAVERGRDLAIVAVRFDNKLSSGPQPDAFPEELPLAPAIAPGLVSLHDRSAAVIDNLNMMLEVITDVLEHPAVRGSSRSAGRSDCAVHGPAVPLCLDRRVDSRRAPPQHFRAGWIRTGRRHRQRAQRLFRRTRSALRTPPGAAAV